MKIKVEVDLSDFYNEPEDNGNASFQEQIKSAIAFDVKNKILSDWKQKIGAEFSSEIKAEIELQKSTLIKDTVKSCFDSKLVKDRYGNEMITIESYVNKSLDNDLNTSRNFQDLLQTISNNSAKEISKNLKDRYDLMFASNLISKMNELGMLKPDVAQLILSKNGQNG